ncbi:hypothetical protein [Streptomyces sp. NPDC056361]|uniref:hypothetical protein n=1 Tax=Streptomyces sp. NPDC056361 TaxID=3345795 RepID=UPI0035DF7073
MRSEMTVPESESDRIQPQDPVQARPKDRFGAVVTASVSVMFVEAAIGMIANHVRESAIEGPVLPYNALGFVVMVIAAPFAALAGAVLGAFLTVSVVMPVLTSAAWLGRRLSGREAWGWVPAVTAVAAGPPVAALAILAEAGLLAGLAGWLAATAALTAPALVARRLLLPDRPRLTGRAMFGRVAVHGTLAVVTAFAAAGIALFAGVGYEPPQLNAEQIAGTYSDGQGGTLTLAPDGRATASRVDTFDFHDTVDPSEPRIRECSGIGTWSFDPVDGPDSQLVTVSVDSCPVDMDDWGVYGTREHPKLYVFVGDPDSWELYTLRHD